MILLQEVSILCYQIIICFPFTEGINRKFFCFRHCFDFCREISCLFVWLIQGSQNPLYLTYYINIPVFRNYQRYLLEKIYVNIIRIISNKIKSNFINSLIIFLLIIIIFLIWNKIFIQIFLTKVHFRLTKDMCKIFWHDYEQ